MIIFQHLMKWLITTDIHHPHSHHLMSLKNSLEKLPENNSVLQGGSLRSMLDDAEIMSDPTIVRHLIEFPLLSDEPDYSSL